MVYFSSNFETIETKGKVDGIRLSLKRQIFNQLEQIIAISTTLKTINHGVLVTLFPLKDVLFLWLTHSNALRLLLRKPFKTSIPRNFFFSLRKMTLPFCYCCVNC